MYLISALALVWFLFLVIWIVLAALGRISWWSVVIWLVPVVLLFGLLILLVLLVTKSPKANIKEAKRLFIPQIDRDKVRKMYVADPRVCDFTSGFRRRRK